MGLRYIELLCSCPIKLSYLIPAMKSFVFLILDEYQKEDNNYNTRSNNASFQPYQYQGNFRYFTSYSEETSSLNVLEESTTIFNGNVGISIKRIRTTMQSNRVSDNQVSESSKNSKEQFLTDQKQVIDEYSSKNSFTAAPTNNNSTAQEAKVRFRYF